MKTGTKILIVAAMAACFAAGAVAAFYGTAQTAENSFNVVAGTAGDEDAGTVSETFDPEDAEDLEPGGSFTKEVALQSNVEYAAWVFMEVEMPVIKATLNGTEGCYNVFTADWNEGTDTDGWTLCYSYTNSTGDTDTGNASGYADSVYIYGYNSVLASGDTTSNLFTTLTEQGFTVIESGLSDNVDVSATLVQETGNEDLSEAWATYQEITSRALNSAYIKLD